MIYTLTILAVLLAVASLFLAHAWRIAVIQKREALDARDKVLMMLERVLLKNLAPHWTNRRRKQKARAALRADKTLVPLLYPERTLDIQ